MAETKTTGRIRFVEVAREIYAALTPVEPLDITDAGMMDNFSNSAYINRGKGLVCDTFFDLAHARELREFCIAQSGHSPGYVVDTHGHWDHYWGNQGFPTSYILGPEGMQKDCAGDAAKLPVFKLLTGSALVQGLADKALTGMLGKKLPEGQQCRLVVKVGEKDFDLSGIRPTPPHRYFSGPETLDLDGTEVQLIPMGAIHSNSDAVVWIPSERVLFAGDIFADCSLPMTLEGGKKWQKAMDYLLDELGAETIVPGHGVVYDRARAENQRAYFTSLIDQFEANYDEHITAEELCARIDVGQYIDHRPRLGWTMTVNNMFSARRKADAKQ